MNPNTEPALNTETVSRPKRKLFWRIVVVGVVLVTFFFVYFVECGGNHKPNHLLILEYSTHLAQYNYKNPDPHLADHQWDVYNPFQVQQLYDSILDLKYLNSNDCRIHAPTQRIYYLKFTLFTTPLLSAGFVITENCKVLGKYSENYGRIPSPPFEQQFSALIGRTP